MANNLPRPYPDLSLKQNRTVKFHLSLSRPFFGRVCSWIPAFAGMTNLKGFLRFTHWACRSINNTTNNCQRFVLFLESFNFRF